MARHINKKTIYSKYLVKSKKQKIELAKDLSTVNREYLRGISDSEYYECKVIDIINKYEQDYINEIIRLNEVKKYLK